MKLFVIASVLEGASSGYKFTQVDISYSTSLFTDAGKNCIIVWNPSKISSSKSNPLFCEAPTFSESPRPPDAQTSLPHF